MDYVARELEHEKDMQGMKVVVSAGGTREPMDPVRYLTNHSTGKMGYAVARACMLRGADVTLLTSSDLPPGQNCLKLSRPTPWMRMPW